jgi:hypothetical protein
MVYGRGLTECDGPEVVRHQFDRLASPFQAEPAAVPSALYALREWADGLGRLMRSNLNEC